MQGAVQITEQEEKVNKFSRLELITSWVTWIGLRHMAT
jgi:hypothetical protein